MRLSDFWRRGNIFGAQARVKAKVASCSHWKLMFRLQRLNFGPPIILTPPGGTIIIPTARESQSLLNVGQLKQKEVVLEIHHRMCFYTARTLYHASDVTASEILPSKTASATPHPHPTSKQPSAPTPVPS
jgi:hypothetical protein